MKKSFIGRIALAIGLVSISSLFMVGCGSTNYLPGVQSGNVLSGSRMAFQLDLENAVAVVSNEQQQVFDGLQLTTDNSFNIMWASVISLWNVEITDIDPHGSSAMDKFGNLTGVNRAGVLVAEMVYNRQITHVGVRITQTYPTWMDREYIVPILDHTIEKHFSTISVRNNTVALDLVSLGWDTGEIVRRTYIVTATGSNVIRRYDEQSRLTSVQIGELGIDLFV